MGKRIGEIGKKTVTVRVGTVAAALIGVFGYHVYNESHGVAREIGSNLVTDAKNNVAPAIGTVAIGAIDLVSGAAHAVAGEGSDATISGSGDAGANMKTPEIGEGWISFLETDFGMSADEANKCYSSKLGNVVLQAGVAIDNPCI